MAWCRCCLTLLLKSPACGPTVLSPGILGCMLNCAYAFHFCCRAAGDFINAFLTFLFVIIVLYFCVVLPLCVPRVLCFAHAGIGQGTCSAVCSASCVGLPADCKLISLADLASANQTAFANTHVYNMPMSAVSDGASQGVRCGVSACAVKSCSLLLSSTRQSCAIGEWQPG